MGFPTDPARIPTDPARRPGRYRLWIGSTSTPNRSDAARSVVLSAPESSSADGDPMETKNDDDQKYMSLQSLHVDLNILFSCENIYPACFKKYVPKELVGKEYLPLFPGWVLDFYIGGAGEDDLAESMWSRTKSN